jgi:hypothetical protein
MFFFGGRRCGLAWIVAAFLGLHQSHHVVRNFGEDCARARIQQSPSASPSVSQREIIILSGENPVDRPPGSNLAWLDEVALEDFAAGRYGLHCPPQAAAFALAACGKTSNRRAKTVPSAAIDSCKGNVLPVD